MALFTDNDRDKVNEDIDLDKDLDELDDEELDGLQDQDSDDGENDEDSQGGKKEDQNNSDDKGGEENKGSSNPEDSAEYWKNKFSESSRENQLERERRKKAEEDLEAMRKPKEVTDDTMKEQYPDWDAYDDGVKAALKKQVIQDQEIQELKKQTTEYHNERKWSGKVQSFLDEDSETEKFGLSGKEAEFRKFVNRPERKGMDLDILAGAFLHEVEKEGRSKPKPQKKGDMLNSGSGNGATKKHTSDKKEYSAEDAKRLRENNPKLYERLVRTGKLDIKI